ncbi:MAG: O-methyltransferase [Streptococcaceae bacterium]|jgi:predicted O-methyltransferase YrrM|nr:O-methyltransferase [Streptococcaceae bacterium]
MTEIADSVYPKAANPMMRRPVVAPPLVDFMRDRQRALTGETKALQDFANAHNIPVIPHETVAFFRVLLASLKPQNILEIGTAIGFSTRLMAEICPDAQITTLERYEEMLNYARPNLAAYKEQITLLEGDAKDILPTLPEASYDFVFMDSAKTQYVRFLPELLRLMTQDALLVIDDVFQAGDVLKRPEDLPRRERNIVKGLNKLFDATLDVPELTTSLLPLGDGLLLIRKAT